MRVAATLGSVFVLAGLAPAQLAWAEEQPHANSKPQAVVTDQRPRVVDMTKPASEATSWLGERFGETTLFQLFQNALVTRNSTESLQVAVRKLSVGDYYPRRLGVKAGGELVEKFNLDPGGEAVLIFLEADFNGQSINLSVSQPYGKGSFGCDAALHYAFDYLAAETLKRVGGETPLPLVSELDALAKACRNGPSTSRRVKACTLLIDFAGADDATLAEAYIDRAYAHTEASEEGWEVRSIADSRKAIDLGSRNWWARYLLALGLQEAGQFAQAEAALEGIGQTKELQVLQLRVDLARNLDQWDEAVVRADLLVKKHPNAAEAWNTRCWLRAVAGRDLNLALADCNRSLQIKPNAPAYDSRALVALKSGRYPDAIADYTAALELNAPPVTLFGRGVAKLRSGDKIGGDADLSEAKRLEPGVETQFSHTGEPPL